MVLTPLQNGVAVVKTSVITSKAAKTRTTATVALPA
jgi:hypothetical protein